jgi:uncharacterized protein (TIGR02246 family)
MTARSPAELSQRFEDAWNVHDMQAFADLFEENATFVSRFGHFWTSRAEITARHAEVHDTIYRDSRISNHLLGVDAIADDLAIGFVQSLISVGRFMPVGPREFSCLFTYVAHRSDGWRIRAAANVAFTDLNTGALRIDPPGIASMPGGAQLTERHPH